MFEHQRTFFRILYETAGRTLQLAPDRPRVQCSRDSLCLLRRLARLRTVSVHWKLITSSPARVVLCVRACVCTCVCVFKFVNFMFRTCVQCVQGVSSQFLHALRVEREFWSPTSLSDRDRSVFFDFTKFRRTAIRFVSRLVSIVIRVVQYSFRTSEIIGSKTRCSFQFRYLKLLYIH